MKQFFIFAIAATTWLTACDEAVTPTPQPNPKPIVKPEPVKDEPLVLPAELAEFVQKTMPTWKTPKPSQWLLANYVTELNKNNPKDMAVFEQDVLIKGDFNGDHKEDYACFLLNEKNEAAVWVFHRKEGGFDAIELVKPTGAIQNCCIGEGLEVQPKALVENVYYDKNKKGDIKQVDLKHDAITVFVYEKVAELYFWNGKSYQSFITAD